MPNIANRTIYTNDNLEIMRGINSASIDLIYLDPPFNSKRIFEAPIGSRAAGSSFIDAWTLDDVKEEWVARISDEHPALAYSIISAGKGHSEAMQAYITYMTVRLMEMRRILKPEGSIYLHCDPAASHYLKTAMDAVFGPDAFQAEITWKRTFSHSDSKTYGSLSDAIFFYGGSDVNVDAIRVPPQPRICQKALPLSGRARSISGRQSYRARFVPRGKRTALAGIRSVRHWPLLVGAENRSLCILD